MPDRRPDIYGEDGVRFFRTWIGVGRPFGLAPSRPEDDVEATEHSLANLSLPRTFFGKSEISSISFRNTNLSESTLCWNDFIEVDFTEADLSGADLRASLFRRVAFVRANLQNTDLRRSNFKECDFTAADMAGARLTRKQGEGIYLSDKQQKVIDWQESEGDEPLGG
ncbi:pentapeptide repeat-containing protein [Gemmata obscuriglobus]|nr:pentapeptide repeat-containing protein [Gemmata obscuriglobus]